jgi:hypothetical protein
MRKRFRRLRGRIRNNWSYNASRGGQYARGTKQYRKNSRRRAAKIFGLSLPVAAILGFLAWKHFSKK